MINTLNDIRTSDKQISGTHGIGVLMANSLMFQRFPDHNGYDDPQFSSFYGQTLPLLKEEFRWNWYTWRILRLKILSTDLCTCNVLLEHETDEIGIP